MSFFTKYAGNPVFGSKEMGTTFDAYTVKVGEKYRMDFSWRKYKVLAFTESTDGINWTEPTVTLERNEQSGWEDNINRNCVLKIGDIYKMWYTGQARGHSFIGYAESRDGIKFERTLPEPIIIPEYPFEKDSVMNPCVLFEDGIYKMWYAAGETFEPNVLCYAESRDGINFTKCRINPIFVKSEHDYEANRVGGCQVIKTKQYGYLMFYIGYRDIHTACICAACSENGITGWKRCKNNPLVTPTENEWDADSCYKPAVVFDEENDDFRIWYNGRHGDDEFIGMAQYKGNLVF